MPVIKPNTNAGISKLIMNDLYKKYTGTFYLNPNDNKYYCSLKKYGSLYPEKCLFILDNETLFKYIKEHYGEYEYVLPFMVANSFRRRLKDE